MDCYQIISIPDALTDDNTISFRIIVSVKVIQELLKPDAEVTEVKEPVQKINFSSTPILRNFSQIASIYTIINKAFPLSLSPALPDSPKIALLSSTDYVSRKRLQMERFLNRILFRREVLLHEQVQSFLGSGPFGSDDSRNMLSSQTFLQSIGVNFGILDHIIKSNSDRGFHIYRPSIELPENNEKDFHLREGQVLLMESNYSKLLDSLTFIFSKKEGFAKLLEDFKAQISIFQKPNSVLGTGSHVDNSKIIVSFGNCWQGYIDHIDSWETLLGKQMKYESSFYFDVVAEYLQMIQSLKCIMNHRTDSLAAYVSSIKDEESKKARMEQMQKNGSTLLKALSTADHSSSMKKCDDCKIVFINAQQNVVKEFVRFERLKLIDMREALFRFAQIQMETQKSLLESMESAQKTFSDFK